MNFEITDEDAEAKRVQLAFDLERFRFPIDVLVPSEKFYLTVEYKPHFRYFKVTDKQTTNIDYADIKLHSNGMTEIEVTSDECSFELARGLFLLGMLTPEIEAELEVTISSHQKVEWKLGFEAKYEVI